MRNRITHFKQKPEVPGSVVIRVCVKIYVRKKYSNALF